MEKNIIITVKIHEGLTSDIAGNIFPTLPTQKIFCTFCVPLEQGFQWFEAKCMSEEKGWVANFPEMKITDAEELTEIESQFRSLFARVQKSFIQSLLVQLNFNGIKDEVEVDLKCGCKVIPSYPHQCGGLKDKITISTFFEVRMGDEVFFNTEFSLSSKIPQIAD